MNMRALLRLELRRAFCNPLFFLSLAVGLGICLWQFAEYILPWWGFQYWVEYPSSVYHLWLGGQNGSLQPLLYYLLIPILCALPYGNSYYFDLQSGYVNQIVTRGERKNYVLAKVVTSFLSGAVIAVLPLLLDFLLTGCNYPAVRPQSGLGFYAIGEPDILGELFYRSPVLYLTLFLLLNAVFFGLMNIISLWAADFVQNRFWIVLMPFLVYMFVFCILQFTNQIRFAPFFFLRSGQPFRSSGAAVLLETGLLLAGTVIFLWRHRRKEGL